jgi:hypothetical protein
MVEANGIAVMAVTGVKGGELGCWLPASGLERSVGPGALAARDGIVASHPFAMKPANGWGTRQDQGSRTAPS